MKIKEITHVKSMRELDFLKQTIPTFFHTSNRLLIKPKVHTIEVLIE